MMFHFISDNMRIREEKIDRQTETKREKERYRKRKKGKKNERKVNEREK